MPIAATGFYLAVLREGEVEAGDPLELIAAPRDRMSVADIARLYTADAPDQELLRRVSELAALPDGWRAHFRARLWKPDA